MTSEAIIAVVALLLSALTFVAMQLSDRRRSRDRFDARMLNQFEQTKESLSAALKELDRLQNENIRLMRLLLKQDEEDRGSKKEE